MIKSSNMIKPLTGKQIAVLVTEDGHTAGLSAICRRLSEAGATLVLIAPEELVKRGTQVDLPHELDTTQLLPVTALRAEKCDGLVLPESQIRNAAVDYRAMAIKQTDCVQLVREFFKLAKPVAALGGGMQYVIAADVLHDRTVTTPAALRLAAIDRSATWLNQPCVCDQGLVSSRHVADIELFCNKAIEEFAEGPHVGQTV